MQVIRVLVIALIALTSSANGQELRAWHTLNFGDDPDTVQAKMVALQDGGVIEPYRPGAFQPYTATSRFPEQSNYPMRLGGIPTWLDFDFYDNKLYRLNFRGSDTYNASELIHLHDDYQTIRSILAAALGPSQYSVDLTLWNTNPSQFTYGDQWTSAGMTRTLGISNVSFRYWWRLDVEWDWMVDFIHDIEKRDRSNTVRDAAEGF